MTESNDTLAASFDFGKISVYPKTLTTTNAAPVATSPIEDPFRLSSQPALQSQQGTHPFTQNALAFPHESQSLEPSPSRVFNANQASNAFTGFAIPFPTPTHTSNIQRQLLETDRPQNQSITTDEANEETVSSITNQISEQRNNGQPLSENLHQQLEGHFDADLSEVRVHTSPQADHLSQSLGAKAFTAGNDIFFSNGQYDPTSVEGAGLIAHEVAHTVQQRQGRVLGTGVDPDQDLEVEARQAGERAKTAFGSDADHTAKAQNPNQDYLHGAIEGIQREPLRGFSRSKPLVQREKASDLESKRKPETSESEQANHGEQVASQGDTSHQAEQQSSGQKEIPQHEKTQHEGNTTPTAQTEQPNNNRPNQHHNDQTHDNEHQPHDSSHHSNQAAHDPDHTENAQASSSDEHSSQDLDSSMDEGSSMDTDQQPELPQNIEAQTENVPEPSNPQAPVQTSAPEPPAETSSDSEPQVTAEQTKAAGQQLINAVRGSANAETQSMTALATEHANQVKQHATTTAQNIRQISSQQQEAIRTSFGSSKTQTTMHANSTKAEVQGAVRTQQTALSTQTQNAVRSVQQTVKTKQNETTQMTAQEANTLTTQTNQGVQSTDQKFQNANQTAQQTGNKGGSSGVAPEVGEAKSKASQQMGEDAAKDVNQAKNETRATQQNQANQAVSTLKQKGTEATSQVGSVLPGAQAALQSKGQGGKQQLGQIATQTTTNLDTSKTAVAKQLSQGQQRVTTQIEKTATIHAARAEQSGEKTAALIQNQANKTNKRTLAALAQFEAQAEQGVHPKFVNTIVTHVDGKFGIARGQVNLGMQGIRSHATNALTQGSNHTAQSIHQTSNHARNTSQQAAETFKTHLDTTKSHVIPAAANITSATSQAQTQANTSTSSQLNTMTAGIKKDFSVGREKIVTALVNDGEKAASTANTKVSSELNSQIEAGQQKIETKASEEKNVLENQGNTKDGQARVEQAQTQTATPQRMPIQRWAWLDSIVDWFGKQWNKLKNTFLSPSFWAGLIVGLVVAIAVVAAVAAIIATGGAAAGVLLALGPLLLPVVGGLAGAAAGFAGTVASNVTHNVAEEKDADGVFRERGVLEGAGRNTLLGLGAGVALAYAPATLPWVIGGGAAINVGVGIYDNASNPDPNVHWYDSIGADAIIGGFTALVGFGAFKGFAGAARGTVVDPTNIPTNAQERFNTQETLNKPQQLRETYANELKNADFSRKLAEIERNPNVNERGQQLNALEKEMQTYQDYYNKAIKNGLPEDLARQSADANAQNPANKPKQNTTDIDELYKQAGKAAPELNKTTEDIAKQTGGKAEYRIDENGEPGLKGRDRAQEKVDEYKAEGGDADQLVDIAGSRIVYKSLAEVYKALEVIKQQCDVVYFKDRYVRPVPSGFRDLLFNVRMSNGHIVELRVTLEAVEAVAKLEHAESYQLRRTIEAKMKAEGRTKMTPEEEAQTKTLLDKFTPMYEQAWNAILNRIGNNNE
jgi:hypothetical protein